MAPDGTGAPGVDQKAPRNQVLTDTIKIVSSASWASRSGAPSATTIATTRSRRTTTTVCAPCSNRLTTRPTGRCPAARQVSLYTDADKKKAAAVEADTAKIATERLKKQSEFIEATFEKELAKLPQRN